MKTTFISIVTLFFSIVTYSQKKWTLKQSVDYALKHNITVQQNKLNIDLAESDVTNAKGNFLPSLNANTSGSLNFGSSFDPVSQNRIATSVYGGSFGLNSSVTLFNGYRNLNTYKQAKLGVESSKLNLEIIQNDITLQIINTYLNALFAKENLQVAKTQSEISTSQITRLEQQFDAGTIAKTDLLNIKSSAANDNQKVVSAENSLNLALFRLSQLLQIESTGFDIADVSFENSIDPLLLPNYDAIYNKAIINRPEIKRQELNIKNSDLNIEIAKSGYYPTVTASANVGSNYGFNLELPKGFSNTPFGTQLDNNLGYGIGFNVNIPIFNGFKNDANVQRAKINKSISQSRLKDQKLQLKQTIQQVYLDAKLAYKTYQASKSALIAQKEAYNNAKVSFEYGTMTLFDFDQVRSTLVSTESNFIRSKYDYIFKTKVLQFYSGEFLIK